MLPAGKARLPCERRVAGGIGKAGRGNLDVTEPRSERELANSRAVAGHVAQDRAKENRNAGFLDRLLDPARQRDLIVHDDGGVGGAAPAIVEGSLGAEVAQNLVGDTMGELISSRPVGEQAAERADDGVDGLPAERGQGIDENHLAAEARPFERRGNPRNAGAQHADVAGYALRVCARYTSNDPRCRGNG